MSGNGTVPLLPGQDPVTGVCSAENVGPLSETITWVLVAVAFLFLSLRLYCKWVKSRTFWWDDWLLGITWVGVPLFGSPCFNFDMHMLTAPCVLNTRCSSLLPALF